MQGTPPTAHAVPPPLRGGLARKQQSFYIFGEDVGFDVDAAAFFLCVEVRRLERVRDQRDGEIAVADRRDRQADAVDGDRALFDDVAQERGRRCDIQQHGVAFLFE